MALPWIFDHFLRKSGGTMSGGLTLSDGSAAEGVVASGTGYIRYASGLQICWGSNVVATASSSRTFTSAKPFIETPVPICCYGDDVNYQDQSLAIDVYDKNALVVVLSKGFYPVRINWCVFGRWK